MKKLNYPIILGTVIILFLLIIVYFGEDMARMDPYAINLGRPQYIDGEFVVFKPPTPPNELFLFGTDVLGRDIYSQLLTGARITLRLAFTITLLRFIVAIPMSFLAGFGNKVSSKLIKFFSTAFSAIPSLIISFILLSFIALRNLELEQSIWAFSIVLTFVGWGRLASILKDRVEDVLSEDFIQGQIAIGKNKSMIAIQNVVPHVLASIIVYAFLEMGRALFIIAQLGIFGVYVGVNKINLETIKMLRLDIIPSYNPEWGGMLATARYAITVGRPWLATYPAFAFLISIMGFNLFGQGLQHEVNKRSSHVITWIKRLGFHLSPKTYIYEVKHLKSCRKPIIIKTLTLLIIILIPLIPPPISPYQLDSEEVFNHVDELSKDSYKGRLVGTEGRDQAADYIQNVLEDSGIKPLFEDKYMDTFAVKDNIPVLENSELVIEGNENIIQSFKFRKDYALNFLFVEQSGLIGNGSGAEEIVVPYLSREILTERQYESGAYDPEASYFLVLETPVSRQMDRMSRMRLENMSRNAAITGLILPVQDDEDVVYKEFLETVRLTSYKWRKSSKDFNPFFIYVNQETANSIRQNKGNPLTLNSNGKMLQKLEIKNVGGMIEGKNTEEPLIITTSYDYLGSDEHMAYSGLYQNGSSVASVLEMAKKLASLDKKPEKSIIFLFLDSSQIGGKGANKFTYSSYMNNDAFYIYLDYLGLDSSDKMYLDTSTVLSNDLDTFDYIKYIKKRSRQKGFEMLNDQLTSRNRDVIEFQQDGVSGIMVRGLNLVDTYNYFGKPQNDITLLDEVKLKEQTQIILDTVVHIVY